MANPRHLAVLDGGVDAWNRWRNEHPRIRPDLSGEVAPDSVDADIAFLTAAIVNEVVPGPAVTAATGEEALVLNGINWRSTDLRGAKLDGAVLIEADLSRADLRNASLAGAVLTGADLRRADLRGANLGGAILRFAKLDRSQLTGCYLRLANLGSARLRGADLRDCDMFLASFVGADLSGADLSGSHVYGVSAWDVELTNTRQERLVITQGKEPVVEVGDLAVAQFLHLILSNRNIRDVVDTLTTKVVLLLGRFSPERKAVLDRVRDALSARGLVPVLFDFERPASRDFTETVVTLAHLARFIVADLTDPASLPKELEAIVPRLAVPVLPIMQRGAEPYAMFQDYWKYDWVLEIVEYESAEALVDHLDDLVLFPAEDSVRLLAEKRLAAAARERKYAARS